MLRAAQALALAALLGAAPILAQDAPGPQPAPEGAPGDDGQEPGPRPAPSPSPAPGKDLPRDVDPAAPGEEVQVEHPRELERVQGELERIRERRRQLSAEEAQLIERARELSALDPSPILAPRAELVELHLEDAIRQALGQNPDYLISLLAARAAAEGVQEAEGAFDPTLSVDGSWSESRTPFFSRNPFSGFPVGLNTSTSERLDITTGLQKRFLLGTTVGVSWTEGRTYTNNTFALNPAYSPSLQLQIVQPLLRGFGMEANEAPIKIAFNQALSSDAQFAQTLLDGALAVEQAYWNLVSAEEGLRSQERSLSSALKFLDDQRSRERVGAASQLDVIIAQAGVASSREALIQAENGLEASRDQLIRLVRPSGESRRWDLFVVPLDRPWILPEPDLDPDRALQMARERRPEYYQALLALDTARRTVALRENEALPSLDVIGSLREDGLGGTHHSAWSALGTGTYYTWSAGVRVGLPLFLRSERARVRAAKWSLEQAEASLQSLEASMVLEVRQAVRDVQSAKARVVASRASRILAARRLNATRTQQELGTAVPRDVLDDLAALTQAENREVQAYIQHRLALSRLSRAQGTLLDPWLADLDPRLRNALNRTGELTEPD